MARAGAVYLGVDRPHVEGWKAIAELTGRSTRWGRYMRQRPERPLPVLFVGGVTRLYLDDYARWVEAELAGPRVASCWSSGRPRTGLRSVAR